jgi:hypothetical protein
MNLIATYADKSYFGRREYKLYPDRIMVAQRDPVGLDLDTRIYLNDLNPDFDRISMRSGFFNDGIGILMVSGLIYWALIELTTADPFGLFATFFLGFAVAGLFMFLVGLRKLRLARFKPLPNRQETLDIIYGGSRREEFDEFVSIVQRTIRSCQSVSGDEQFENGDVAKPPGGDRPE